MNGTQTMLNSNFFNKSQLIREVSRAIPGMTNKQVKHIIQERYGIEVKSKSKPITDNNFSESFFEKIDQKEFETSIYNQMSCSTILSSYYQQIVNDEKTTFVNRD